MKTWFLFACVWLATAAQAHEFWMVPDRFSPAPGTPVTLSLWVGERFEGEPAAFGRPMAISLRWYRQRGTTDLTDKLPAGLVPGVALAFEEPGTQLMALDTQPFTIELGAAEFTAYLREDGLEHVMAQREAKGHSATPGRERYRRHVKTLLNVGGQSNAVFGVRTGQTLEIVPRKNPHTLKPGDALPVEVLFKGAPLSGALVKVWSRRGEQFDVFTSRTDAAGQSTTTLPRAGPWMVSVVHMVPNTDGQGQDWDSHWGNLTFELPAPGGLRQTP